MTAPSYAGQNTTVASCNMEKPCYQIPKKRLCCALRSGFRMLREEGPKVIVTSMTFILMYFSPYVRMKLKKIPSWFNFVGFLKHKGKQKSPTISKHRSRQSIVINTTVITLISNSTEDSCTANGQTSNEAPYFLT